MNNKRSRIVFEDEDAELYTCKKIMYEDNSEISENKKLTCKKSVLLNANNIDTLSYKHLDDTTKSYRIIAKVMRLIYIRAKKKAFISIIWKV